jgi:hypothetical protein
VHIAHKRHHGAVDQVDGIGSKLFQSSAPEAWRMPRAIGSSGKTVGRAFVRTRGLLHKEAGGQ